LVLLFTVTCSDIFMYVTYTSTTQFLIGGPDSTHPLYSLGVCSGAVGSSAMLQAGRSQVRFPMVSLEFFIDIILWSHYGPGVGSASNRNEYQEYLLWGGKGGWCAGLTTLPPSCTDSLKIWKPQPP
jgi:hypothetical protein